MSPHPPEHITHDKINLGRLVRRLEKSISDWDKATHHDAWIKIQATFQKVKYAKNLLKNVEMYGQDPTPKAIEQYRNTELKLDRIESFVLNLENRFTPTATRPAPLLPSIPIPLLSAVVSPNTLFSPAIPNISTAPTSPTNTIMSTIRTPAPAFSQNSNALQQELANQLAQMAAQLKHNATHFSESLTKDQAVIEGAKVKIEGNFDMMKTQRTRLRDHTGKSGSTTCLVLMSLVVVVISFVLMFFVIRLT